MEKVIPRGEGRFPFPSLIFNYLIAGDKKKNEHGENIDNFGLEYFPRQIKPSQLHNRNSQLPQSYDLEGEAILESILFKRVEKALQESQGLTRNILDSAFDAIISMDGDGRVINWNKRAETIFGWSSSETVGKILSDIVIPPQFRESHEKGLERFLATGKSKVINQQIEIFALRKDGYEFPVEISISATPWEDSFIFNGIIQ